MGNKTILQYFNEHTNASNVVFVAGRYEFRINKALDGTITAQHNFSSNGWTNVPDADTINVQSHFSERDRISSIEIKDIDGNSVFEMLNEPQLVVF